MQQATSVTDTMREFWNSKAKENAPFYIATQARFWKPDMAEFWASGELDLRRILAESPVKLSGSEVALEIGCGIGRMSHALARRVGEIHSLDIAPEMIDQAREHHAAVANLQFHLGSGADLGIFADGTFDFVFSFIVLQHIPDPVTVLDYVREMGRVLRPGGRALFQLRTTPEGPTPAPRAKQKRGQDGGVRVEEVFGSGYDSPAWIGSAVSMADLRRAVADGGMTLRSTKDAGSQYTWVRCVR